MTGLLSGFATMDLRWQDMLDILITAYILYRVLLLMRGTLAIKMVSALVVLVIAFRASQFFNLHVLNWLLQNMWTVGLLAAVILFQPELRRALAQIFPGGLSFRQQVGDQAMVGEIMKAVAALSSGQIGALIVLEREDGLPAIREMGALVDSVVTGELIRVIFHPASVLHDGAIIIREGRIDRAGCFLPLTKNPYLPATMGTRHRAAIGATEETDALVVVVSEETGRISVAQRGELKVVPDTTRLREILQDSLGIRSES